MDKRGASSVVGSLLVVGVAVILAATVAVVALSIVDESETGPQAAFNWEYDEDSGNIYWTYVNNPTLLRSGG